MRITSSTRALRSGGAPLPPVSSPLVPGGAGENPVPALRRPRTGTGSPVQSAQADFVWSLRRIHSLGRDFARIDAARSA
jgi:hypothetical protein